jgi:hypothetical protein
VIPIHRFGEGDDHFFVNVWLIEVATGDCVEPTSACRRQQIGCTVEDLATQQLAAPREAPRRRTG